jgi:cobalt-zinc-cadmium efflux system membrane fusion protein
MAAPVTVTRADHGPAQPQPHPHAKRRGNGLKFGLVFLAAIAVGLGGAYFSGMLGKDLLSIKEAEKHLASAKHSGNGHGSDASDQDTPAPTPYLTDRNAKWDGLVEVNQDAEKALGFAFATVEVQTKPILLELNGRTAYDPNTITKVRSRFDTKVENVRAELGQKVKKGDPLVELSSTDLAAAKSDFQQKYVQWQHDLKLKNLRRKLYEDKAISEQLWVDTQNDEQKSRLDFQLAHDKLSVTYEVPEEQLDPLLANLADKSVEARQFGSTADKAKMIMLSKGDGIVIKRDVVKGNYYETTDVLMEIAPLDHLWVWVNVYEIDQDKIEPGLKMVIQFLSHEEKVVGKIDYVASEVSQDTRAVKVRATIPNPDARLKSDMLVKAMLEIPKVRGQTVVPRLAVVSVSGVEYVFVRKAKGVPAGGENKSLVDKFERRRVILAQENSSDAIIASGLEPGMEVATNGSLILAQLYEDQRTSLTGLPAQ